MNEPKLHSIASQNHHKHQYDDNQSQLKQEVVICDFESCNQPLINIPNSTSSTLKCETCQSGIPSREMLYHCNNNQSIHSSILNFCPSCIYKRDEPLTEPPFKQEKKEELKSDDEVKNNMDSMDDITHLIEDYCPKCKGSLYPMGVTNCMACNNDIRGQLVVKRTCTSCGWHDKEDDMMRLMCFICAIAQFQDHNDWNNDRSSGQVQENKNGDGHDNDQKGNGDQDEDEEEEEKKYPEDDDTDKVGMNCKKCNGVLYETMITSCFACDIDISHFKIMQKNCNQCGWNDNEDDMTAIMCWYCRRIQKQEYNDYSNEPRSKQTGPGANDAKHEDKPAQFLCISGNNKNMPQCDDNKDEMDQKENGDEDDAKDDDEEEKKDPDKDQDDDIINCKKCKGILYETPIMRCIGCDSDISDMNIIQMNCTQCGWNNYEDNMSAMLCFVCDIADNQKYDETTNWNTGIIPGTAKHNDTWHHMALERRKTDRMRPCTKCGKSIPGGVDMYFSQANDVHYCVPCGGQIRETPGDRNDGTMISGLGGADNGHITIKQVEKHEIKEEKERKDDGDEDEEEEEKKNVDSLDDDDLINCKKCKGALFATPVMNCIGCDNDISRMNIIQKSCTKCGWSNYEDNMSAMLCTICDTFDSQLYDETTNWNDNGINAGEGRTHNDYNTVYYCGMKLVRDITDRLRQCTRCRASIPHGMQMYFSKEHDIPFCVSCGSKFHASPGNDNDGTTISGLADDNYNHIPKKPDMEQKKEKKEEKKATDGDQHPFDASDDDEDEAQKICTCGKILEQMFHCIGREIHCMKCQKLIECGSSIYICEDKYAKHMNLDNCFCESCGIELDEVYQPKIVRKKQKEQRQKPKPPRKPRKKKGDRIASNIDCDCGQLLEQIFNQPFGAKAEICNKCGEIVPIQNSIWECNNSTSLHKTPFYVCGKCVIRMENKQQLAVNGAGSRSGNSGDVMTINGGSSRFSFPTPYASNPYVHGSSFNYNEYNGHSVNGGGDNEMEIMLKLSSLQARITELHEAKLQKTSLLGIKDYIDFKLQSKQEQAAIMEIVDMLKDMKKLNGDYYYSYCLENKWASHIMHVFDNVVLNV